MEGVELVLQHTRWQLGDGNLIRFSTEKWILMNTHLKLNTLVILLLMKVKTVSHVLGFDSWYLENQ